ncbi:ATP-binding protein, partial [Streptomyces sp. SID5926]|nr:ATP-binding protein [Streptomyces sp. SID5926]
LMTVVFLIGVSAMGKTDASDGMAALSDAMAGIVVMVLVLLCPYATYKFVHWASDGGGHDDMHRTGVAGMAVAAGAAKTVGSLAMRASTGTPAPQGPNQVPGAGTDGVASGINPSGTNLSKEGIDAGPPKQQTRFRYGEDPNASGDKGRALIQRPGIPPLITRPGEDEPDGSESTAHGVSGGSGQLAAAAAPRGNMTSMPPAGPTPSAAGSPTPSNWVYPTQPPSGS